MVQDFWSGQAIPGRAWESGPLGDAAGETGRHAVDLGAACSEFSAFPQEERCRLRSYSWRHLRTFSSVRLSVSVSSAGPTPAELPQDSAPSALSLAPSPRFSGGSTLSTPAARRGPAEPQARPPLYTRGVVFRCPVLSSARDRKAGLSWLPLSTCRLCTSCSALTPCPLRTGCGSTWWRPRWCPSWSSPNGWSGEAGSEEWTDPIPPAGGPSARSEFSAFPQWKWRLLRSYYSKTKQRTNRASRTDWQERGYGRTCQRFIGQVSVFHRSGVSVSSLPPRGRGVSVSSEKLGTFPQFWTTLAVSVSSVCQNRRTGAWSRPRAGSPPYRRRGRTLGG